MNNGAGEKLALFIFKFKNNQYLKMKRILLVASLFIPSFSFAQSNHFGLIQDKDGYVNVRDQASTKSKVVDKLNNGDVVSFVGDYAENQFSYVLYAKNGSGYIHESRINKFKDFQERIVFFIDHFLIEGKILPGVKALVLEEDN